MALIDAKLLLCSKANIYTAAQLAAFDPVDLGAEYDAGVGEPLVMEVTITTAFLTGTTFGFTITTCTTSGGTYVTIATGKAYAIADLAIGKVIRVPVPEGVSRYLKAGAVLTGSANTAGAGTIRFVPAA